MTDITVTAASVLSGAGATIERGVSGATITAGQAVYFDTADGKYKLADCNSATAAVRLPRGIALNGASAGQPLSVQTKGPITIGATLTLAGAYALSDTPGGICPFADIGAGEYATILGIATTTGILNLNITASGVAPS